ncbi:MAG TPA: phenylacetate--CoA ligase family protein [Sulfurospirillum arcachonense]|nr:phenylacetate--CoA ligase family protein [Sulfurospirillum arcachonense]HIP43987.1 phenylacetate--CoA ligase family protein [Sulfurospirillum arcachonense]
MWSKAETLPRLELEKLQTSRLKETIARVYGVVPFYQQKFKEMGIVPEDIKSIKDITKLPFTRKQDLRDNYPFGMFAVNQDAVVRIHSSSGTTGKPTVVGYTKSDMDVWNEVMARVFTMSGINSEDTVHNAYGYGLFTGGLGVHNGAETVGATVVPSSGGFTSRQLLLMKDFNSTVLTSTPSFALHMAETAKKEGYDIKKDFKLKCGIFGAEPTSVGLKEEVSRVWGIDYYEIYGLSEIIGPGVSNSCCESRDLHIFEDHFYPEIVDSKTGEVLPYGEKGELVITTLTKQALPIIRYRTGDITSLDLTPCKCGRTHVRMKSVMGRVDDMLIVNGVNIFPSQVEHVLSNISDITLNYQIIANKKGYLDSLEIMVEVTEEMPMDSIGALEKIQKNIQSELLNNLYINAKIRLVEPRSIERSMGKAIRVIDKRSL